ncbi:helix-turn-helix domain-containing protein [Pseudomonas sp. NBRC 111144]|uniref:helix-turn-helix domain-containing protein n=1 Tax=Pseudomonas sp. NBRC 111144 TaxID=1661059 RepID=UPI0006D3F399|nr:helix-turn-helix transcriptional regulator [Pseudomonas sp. NBRC 111144]
MSHIEAAVYEMSIGENIRKLRETHGVSQKTLAEAIGSGENTVSGWEKSKSTPTGEKVVAMAKFFKCTTDQILLEPEELETSSEFRYLLNRLETIPAPIRALATSTINSILTSLENEIRRDDWRSYFKDDE